MKLVWSEEALQNIRSIAFYIAQDAPERAISYMTELESRTRHIARFPKLGRIVPELKDDIIPPRELLIDPYRMMYRIHAHHIEIVAIVHGKRRLSSD